MSELTDEELGRYARQIVLPEIGGVGQRRLKAARIAVVGAGGIGSAVIPALAGAGIGRLTIIDDDRVEESNLHRQLIFRSDQLGQPKAALAAAFAQALNPLVAAEGIGTRLDAKNAGDLLHGTDVILDGSDNFATRLVVGDTAVRLRIPLVSAAAARFQAQVALFRGWDDTACYRCFVGNAFDSDDCDNCAEVGVLGALTAMAGGFAALVAIQLIAGAGPPAGMLHLYQGAVAGWRQVRIPKDRGCSACGGMNAPDS